MYLKQLKLSTFRNLHSTTLDFCDQFNWIFGKNGSGKTSLLETIYLLSTGRSFRTRYAGEFIQEGESTCVAFGSVLAKNGSQSTRLGIERHRSEGLRLRMNEQPFDTLSEWVKILPLQLINIDSYQLLNGPPKPRRQFLDWAMFHVEHSYFSHLQRYRRALKQRNAALKTRDRRNISDVLAWNPELIEAGEAITALRRQFVEAFSPIFKDYLTQFFTKGMSLDEVRLNFSPGWNEKFDLSTAFTTSLERDIAFGYTSIGPHRADICFLQGNIPVETRLSRGQLKMFISALYLARSGFVSRVAGRAPVCLVDDLCSELDREASIRLLTGLLAQKAQVFTTSIDKDIVLDHISAMEGLEFRMFHVEHGLITPQDDLSF